MKVKECNNILLQILYSEKGRNHLFLLAHKYLPKENYPELLGLFSVGDISGALELVKEYLPENSKPIEKLYKSFQKSMVATSALYC